MGAATSIGWTDATFNPWWGCARVSKGCEHCYAETFAKRVGQKVWGPASTTERRLFGDPHWAEPERWNESAALSKTRRRVFCASMADVFEEHPQLPEPRASLFDLIERTPWLDWQLLTKRPENVERMVPPHWASHGFPPNVWMGASVEDQEAADRRIIQLADIPARVRFLSVEPLLGDVYLGLIGAVPRSVARVQVMADLIHWVIVGGESGPGARPMELEWAKAVVRECSEAGVPVFVKQLGAAHGSKKDAKGEAIESFPPELQRREFPA